MHSSFTSTRGTNAQLMRVEIRRQFVGSKRVGTLLFKFFYNQGKTPWWLKNCWIIIIIIIIIVCVLASQLVSNRISKEKNSGKVLLNKLFPASA